jgi:predicted RNA-binding Zn ribbon-like protein
MPAFHSIQCDPVTMTHPPPILIGESRGIDFLNSIATPVDVPVEWLGDGEALLSWLKHTDLVPASVLDTFRRTSLPGELDAAAAQARGLREWFRAFVYQHKGRRLRREDLRELGPLNQVLDRDEAYGQIAKSDVKTVSEKSSLVLRTTRRWRSAESLLIPIAQAMAELVCSEDFTQVKACEGPTCTLLFLDRTLSQRRRWCSMAVCGNRAKQSAHRRRNRSASPR